MCGSEKTDNGEKRRQSKKELKTLRRQRKKEDGQKVKQRKRTKRLFVKGLAAFLIGAGIISAGWYFITRSSIPAEELISRTGIHWHAALTITILGKIQEIPANIGLGAIENPVHTHAADGVIHLEFPNFVKKDDIRLSRFFEIWGKKFNRDCIFDKCNGPRGKVKMFVNGKQNLEFENYIMQDKDKIEIIFDQ